MDIEDTTVVRWNRKSDWVLAIGYWLLGIGYWVLGMGDWILVIGYGKWAIGDGLFQVFVYGIDANACSEEAEGSYVAMVGIE